MIRLMLQINGPRAVVLDVSDEHCPHRMLEAIFEKETTKMGITGYKVDPKVSPKVSVLHSLKENGY